MIDMNSPSPTLGLSQARRFLREEQARAAKGALGFPYAHLENVTEQSVGLLKRQRQFVPTSDPNIVRRGVFRFDREPEVERIRRSEDLVRRVEPGPFEDPGYFAFLAYQAASIEMALPLDHKDRFSRFLLGTVHAASVNAFSQRFSSTGYTVVALHSGIIDFIYQSAKAVVDALNPVRTPDASSFVRSNADLERIRAELKTNDAPVDRVYRTLESYFFQGYPRAFANEAVFEEPLRARPIEIRASSLEFRGHPLRSSPSRPCAELYIRLQMSRSRLKLLQFSLKLSDCAAYT